VATRKVLWEDLVRFWPTSGVALCAEAQADGVPCTVAGKACETCEHAVATFLAAHPDYKPGHSNGRRTAIPEYNP
jgi:hypothetical protein